MNIVLDKPFQHARIFTKKAIRKQPIVHFTHGIVKSSAMVSATDVILHHKIPDLATTVTDATFTQTISTITWVIKEIM
jgi:hypothetical protein